MATSTEPDGSQPASASTAEARRWLDVTPKTARLWIKKGELDGWKTAGGHYHFHLPPRFLKGPRAQPNAPAPAGGVDHGTTSEAELRAELAAAQQVNTELLIRIAAAEEKQAAAEAQRALAEDAQRRLLAANTFTIEAAKKLSASSELAREGSDGLWKAIEIQRDLLAEHLTPDDLSQLPQLPQH